MTSPAVTRTETAEAIDTTPTTVDLEEMLATDDDEVDTAIIPRLALAPEDAAAPAVPAAVAPVAVARRAHRHASAESLDAVRRNQVALLTVVVGTVLVGTLVGIVAGWVGIAGYAVLVGSLLLTRHVLGRRHAPRHSRYAPRHG